MDNFGINYAIINMKTIYALTTTLIEDATLVIISF